MGAVLLPMGRISGDVITPGGDPVSQSVSGFGDPTFEFNLNLIGPKAQKNLQDVSCATNRAFRSTCWRISRSRSASTTAASR